MKVSRRTLRHIKLGLVSAAALAAVGAQAAGVDLLQIVATHPQLAIGLAGVGLIGSTGNVFSGAGSTLDMKAAQPTAFTSVAYDAMTGFTRVGEIDDLGEFGRVYNVLKRVPVAGRGTVKKKGSFDEGTMNLKLGLDTDDAGQILMKTALNSDNDYTFKVTTSAGDKYYFQAQVTSFKVTVGGADSWIMAACALEISTNSPGIGIVESLAA
jgi:hypothetical protein